jgi:hypothetical protein
MSCNESARKLVLHLLMVVSTRVSAHATSLPRFLTVNTLKSYALSIIQQRSKPHSGKQLAGKPLKAEDG